MNQASAIELVASGREQEIDLLVREHEESRTQASARFVFVHGPAGIGKSHLFRAARRAFAARGVRVLESAAPRSAAGAHSLFSGLLAELLGMAAELGVPARTVAELSRRLGPIDGMPAPERLSPEERRLDLCDAVAELFSLASAACPCFLFSDVEAADRASLELLRYLAAAVRAPGARSGGLFVLSYRESPLPAPLAELIERTPAVSVPLSGLDLDGIRAFLARRDIAERVLEATGGVPVALEDLVAAPSSRPADLFQRRLESLGEAERACLLTVAVLGEPAEAGAVAEIVAKALGLQLTEPAALLERLARERILEARPAVGGALFSFAREPSRQSVLALASAADIAALHAAAGERMAAHGADSASVALHFLAAEPAGRGARAALEAADLLAKRLAFDEAADLYQKALDGLPQAEKPEAQVRLAQALRGAGDYAGAMRELAHARRGLAPAGERALFADAAALARLMGKLAAAERLCLKVMGGSPAPDPADPAGAEAFVAWADVLFLRGKYAEARAQCERGIAALGAIPERSVALRNILGKTLLTLADYPEAGRQFELNAEAAHAAGLRHEEARALINQGVVAHRRGDRRAAIGHYRAGLALCGSDRALSALALSNLGSLYADSGDFEPAVEHLTRALSAFTRARRAKEVAHCALNLARLSLFLGETERAAGLDEHAAAVAREIGDPYLLASAELLRGELLEARGALADAVTALGNALQQFEAIASPRYAAESALLLARVHLARGDRSLARGVLANPSIATAAQDSAPLAAEREMLGGELALLAGDLAEASRRLSAAKDLLLDSPDLEGPCRVYHLLARLRAAAGDPAGAAACALRASQLLEDLVARVPAASRAAFLRHPRRAAILAASAGREITPTRLARALELEPAHEPESHGLIGASPALRKVLAVLDPVGRSNATVLVRGESGTGKELLAEAIHRRSPRRDMPLVRVNCAAMVEELLLSELFGHEKGAFTGAIRERKGRFELAEGGTLFLDEIGDISPKAQVALLRVLQEHEYERVGGTKTLHADVRVICATNRDLEAMIAQGTFRQDLYYRLKGVMLELPPLRTRLEDLPELCEHFLRRVATERHEEKKVLAPESLELLRAHPWPGNVRELENVIASASIFAAGRVIGLEAFANISELAALVSAAQDEDEEEDLEPAQAPAANAPQSGLDFYEIARARGISLKDLRQEIETQCILKALGEAKGNISEAARLLQMKRSRLSQIVNADPTLRAAAKG